MNNLFAALAERMAAIWIERIAGSQISTIAGLLGIVATFVAQLTSYIPAPFDTYVSLGGVILAGVAAILARDSASHPVTLVSGSKSSSTAKLGVWALCSLLLAATMPMMGCSTKNVAQSIVNWTPALQSVVAVADSTAGVLDPASAAIFAGATVAFDANSNVLVAEAKAYLAHPNATVLAQLQTAVVTFQQNVNVALLSAAKITNPLSQQKALTDINAVGTVVNAILALVSQVSTKAQVAKMASEAPVKVAQVLPLVNRQQAASLVAAHYGESAALASEQTRRTIAWEMAAGF